MKSKKALYNIISQFAYEIVVLISGLIIPRLILKSYGSEYNGIVSSITQFLEYISILTLGVSGSTRVAIYKAKGDILKISRILKATSNFMKKVCYFFIAYTIILAIVYPFIIQASISWYEISSLVIIISIGLFAEYFFGVTYNAFTSAMQCKYIYNVILIILKIVSTIISVLLIYFGQSIHVVKFVGAICFALGPILLNYTMNKKFKIIKDVEPDMSALNQRKDVMAHSIANCVHQYTDVFLLSIFSTAKIVSVYAVYNIVLNGIKKSETIFTSGLEGAFGDLWAREQKESFRTNFNTFEFLVFSFVSIIFITASFLILPFITLYTKNVHDVNYILPLFAYLSLISTAFYCIRTPYLIAVQAAGKYKETRNGAIVEATLNFFISLFLIFPLGIVGITIGTLVANLFRTIQYEIYASKNLLNRSNIQFIKKILWIFMCFVIVNCLYLIIPKINITSWKLWIVSGLYYSFITLFIVIIMASVFYRSELIKSFELLKKMIIRKGKK